MDDGPMKGRQVPDAAEKWQHDALPKGTLLQGYRIDRILGRGGFGITYQVSDVIGLAFAVKEFFPDQYSRRDGLAVRPVGPGGEEEVFRFGLDRFLREAQALVRLTGEGKSAGGIVRVNTLFEANGTAYLVMELLRGEALQSLIDAMPGGIERGRLRGLMLGVLKALGTVHDAGMLHRDLKPANIFLRHDGSPVLIDFGAVRARYRDGPRVPFTLIFSEKFAPIEQMQGDLQEPSADLYAFGATMYLAVGGSLISAVDRAKAFANGRVDPLAPARVLAAGRYDADLLQAIDYCLCVQAQDRPQSTAEILDFLAAGDTTALFQPLIAAETTAPPVMPQGLDARLGASGLGQAPADVTLVKTGRSRPRRWLIAGLLILALVLTLAGIGYWFEQRQAAQQRAAQEKAEQDAARALELDRQRVPPPAAAPAPEPPPAEPPKPVPSVPVPAAIVPPSLPAPSPAVSAPPLKQPAPRQKRPSAASAPPPITVPGPHKPQRQMDAHCSELLAKSSLGVDPLTAQEREYFKAQCQ